jgi:hypothetical protein
VSVAALRRDDHSSKESYRLCKKDYETEEEARTQQWAVDALKKLLLLFLVIIRISNVSFFGPIEVAQAAEFLPSEGVQF